MSSTTLTLPLLIELSPFTVMISPVVTTNGSVQLLQYDIDTLAKTREVLFWAVSVCLVAIIFWLLRRVGSLEEEKKMKKK